MPRSGDPCHDPDCNGSLWVRDSKPSVSGAYQYQYLECAKCGKRPENNVVKIPADRIRRRKVRM